MHVIETYTRSGSQLMIDPVYADKIIANAEKRPDKYRVRRTWGYGRYEVAIFRRMKGVRRPFLTYVAETE